MQRMVSVRHRRDASQNSAGRKRRQTEPDFAVAIAQVPETELRAGAVNARRRAPDRARSARSAEALTGPSTAPGSCARWPARRQPQVGRSPTRGNRARARRRSSVAERWPASTPGTSATVAMRHSSALPAEVGDVMPALSASTSVHACVNAGFTLPHQQTGRERPRGTGSGTRMRSEGGVAHGTSAVPEQNLGRQKTPPVSTGHWRAQFGERQC